MSNGATTTLPLAARTRIRIATLADASNITGDEPAEIDVSTGVKPTDTPDEMAQRYQVQAHYVFKK